ncbi:MAG: hypothetical protein ACLUGP_08205 [Faecalibacterium prausnitzii]
MARHLPQSILRLHRSERIASVEVDGNRQFINESQAELIGWEARLQTGKERKRQIRNFAVNSMPSHYRRYFCKNDWLRAAWLGEEPGWRALVGGERPWPWPDKVSTVLTWSLQLRYTGCSTA